jgi:hypothetical protein
MALRGPASIALAMTFVDQDRTRAAAARPAGRRSVAALRKCLAIGVWGNLWGYRNAGINALIFQAFVAIRGGGRSPPKPVCVPKIPIGGEKMREFGKILPFCANLRSR